jgi:hypothetical protein
MANFWLKQTSSRVGVTSALGVSSTIASAATSAFGAQTYQIRVAATATTFLAVGDGTPTATTSSAIIPANTIDYFTVTPGQKAAALGQGAAGTVTITEMS